MDGLAPGKRQDIVAALSARLEARPVEERLLTAAARIRLDEEDIRHLEHLLAEQPNWDLFVAKAEAHGVGPLVYYTLSQSTFASLVPTAALSRLHDRFLTNAVSNLLWQWELKRIVARLRVGGVSPILLKGAALLQTVYSDPAQRQLRDLDLLVQRRELPTVEEHLLELGYVPAEERWPVGVWPTEWYEKKYRLRSPHGRGTLVEIHWGLARKEAPFCIGTEELMRTSEAVMVDGIEARVLGPTHQIIHICTHLAYNDGFGVGLSRLSDLHETVQKLHYRLDWESLAARARQMRASLCLRYSLATASALFGTDLPSTLFESPADPPLRLSLATAALERVLVNDADPAPLPSTLARLVSTDRISLRTVWRFLLPRPRHLRHSYQLMRPARLLRAICYARSMRGEDV